MAVLSPMSSTKPDTTGAVSAPLDAPADPMVLTICICTHNPRTELLYGKVLPALRRQTVAGRGLSLLIVDNASEPPIDAAACQEAAGPDINVQVILELQLGNVHARARLIAETSTPWILFVDDDLELSPHYVENGLRIIAENPEIGCFGGKLILPDYLKPAPWVRPLLPFLAIRDYGDEPITRCADEWGPWEPPTAGGFVCRRVLLRYLNRIRIDANTHVLGRKGRRSLLSGEDSLMMRGAFEEGLASSYQPSLWSRHHLDDRRFGLRYLMRLMYGYGRSAVVLDRLLRPEQAKATATDAASTKSRLRLLGWLWLSFRRDCQESLPYAACHTAFRIGYHLEQRIATTNKS
jgi:glycosyltransferase involved in cell wall biosynthesis